ncbi:MAG: hypothetical protein ACODAE_10700 [Gemmatimonadota bacterium]
MRARLNRRTWRSFGRREARWIEARLTAGAGVLRCPRCGGCLEARPTTRLRATLPVGADGYDLDCRDCRRFHPRIRHSPRSLYHDRIRRFAAAVRNA